MDGKTPERKKWDMVKCILLKIKSLGHPKGMRVFGVFPTFFLLNKIHCAIVKSSAVCNQMFPGSLTIISLLV